MPPTTDVDGAIFDQLRPRLKAISRRIVGSDAEAEDVVQDCFFKWHDADQAAMAAPVAWLTTVVQHRSIDRLRKRSRDAQAADAAMELTPALAVAAPDDGLLRREALNTALVRLLGCLSPSERLALVLHEVFECGHADIAVALGTKVVNARQHLARARRRLREHPPEAATEEKLCRELIRRFQAAINTLDVPAIVTLIGDEQPVSVHAFGKLNVQTRASANDAVFFARLAA